MVTLLAHANHSHTMESMNAVDHCLPVALGAGIIIVVLLGIIVYMLTTWQPKTKAKVKTGRKKSQ